MSAPINITKKYRFRNGQPARILCTDAPGKYPVITIAEDGDISQHTKTGGYMRDGHCEWDLIEVREPREWVIRFYEDGTGLVDIAGPAAPRGETLRLREVIEEGGDQ